MKSDIMELVTTIDSLDTVNAADDSDEGPGNTESTLQTIGWNTQLSGLTLETHDSSTPGSISPSVRAATSRVRNAMTVAQVRAQEWMDARSEGVTFESIGTDKVVIFSVHVIEPPPQFQPVWFTLHERHRQCVLSQSESSQLVRAEQVLIFADVLIPDHLEGTVDIVQSICSLGVEAPPVILVPHSMAPQLREEDIEAEFDMLAEFLVNGIDEVIVGEPSGWHLAYELQCRIMQQANRADELNEKINAHRAYLRYICDVEDGIEESVWDYLRVRLRTQLPAIDDDIEPDVPPSVSGMLVGQKLGEGAFGVVCRLINPKDTNEDIGQVLKVVLKKPLTDLNGIVSLRRQLNVMKKLSSHEHSHVNIAKFFEVYHSETHILFRMEDGGPLDLYKRLVLLEKDEMPLGTSKAAAVVNQLISGLCHMHAAEVTHRDLKPENIITSENEEGIVVKISDFDTAQLTKLGTCARGVVGTFPFMAPEVVLTQVYEALPTDIWSFGVVVLETLCSLSILKKALSFPRSRRGMRHAEKKERERSLMLRIQNHFKASDNINTILEQFHRAELAELVSETARILRGVLVAPPGDRWKADKLLTASRYGHLFLPDAAVPNELRPLESEDKGVVLDESQLLENGAESSSQRSPVS